METKKNIAAAVVGTSLMTLFSYLLTKSQKKNYTEPEVLSEIVDENNSSVSEKEAKALGWTAHYGVGLAFTSAYSLIWEHTSIKPSIASGATLGALSGLLGILGWSQLFQMHHSTSTTYKAEYYMQLILAHIIFGIGAAKGYKLGSKF
ncbi:hypothetical protein [Solitalea longa]|nr:hypothetical protein [Solitalea longa]